MKRIYFDHASTSFPKPEAVIEAMNQYMTQVGCNINRGGYEKAYDAAEIVYETRQLLCELFDFPDPKNVVFTMNITYAANMIIKGYLKPGDHVLVSEMEHNAVMRPLNQLSSHGIVFSRIPCTDQGELKVDQIESMIQKNTKAVIMTAASNVCGTIMPLMEVGRICKANHLTFIVDSAQAAGVLPLSMQKMNIDVLLFTGHKGLLGPQGIGGFIINDKIAEQTEPLISGGTGSISDTELIPDFLPDKFEAGTMNLPGIYGLHAGLSFLNEQGIDSVREKEMYLTKLFLKGLKERKGIRIIGLKDGENRTSVVSIQTDGTDEAELAFRLDQEYGIMTRVGIHCAPNAHKTLGTFPNGTLRFSIGYNNSEAEVYDVLKALQELTKE